MHFHCFANQRPRDESTCNFASFSYTSLCGVINCQILNCPGSFNGVLPREIASWRSTTNRVRLPPGYSILAYHENLFFRRSQLHFRGSLASQRQFISAMRCHHNAAQQKRRGGCSLSLLWLWQFTRDSGSYNAEPGNMRSGLPPMNHLSPASSCIDGLWITLVIIFSIMRKTL